MTDDKIVPLHPPKPREMATCTGHVPTDDQLERGGLRHLDPDLAPAAELLGQVGMDPGRWPGMAVRPRSSVDEALGSLHRDGSLAHSEGSTRVGRRTLRELRDRALSAAAVDRDAEKALLIIATQVERAATMVTLSRVENESIAGRLTELLGDDDNPKGAA